MKSIQNKAQRIAFFHPEGVIDTVPCIQSMLQYLTEQGYYIDIFVLEDARYEKPRFTNSKIRIHYFKIKHTHRMLNYWYLYIPKWINVIHREIKGNNYAYFIGVDPLGLITAAFFSKLMAVHYVYLSLEVYVKNEIKMTSLKYLKKVEIICNKNAKITIIQDSNRAKLLMRENEINRNAIELLPNSSIGEVIINKSYYLHDKFNIDKKMTIVLHAGSVEKWGMPLEIAETCCEWPDDTVFVIHARKRLGDDDYSLRLREMVDGEKIILSEDPVPYSELDNLVASADIGIALYQLNDWHTSGENLSTIGLSSGKIAQYLKCSKPVITTDLEDLRTIIDKYRIGIAVADVSGIAPAIRTIKNELDLFRQNAARCYNEVFEMTKPFQKIMDKLKNVKAV